MTTQTPGKSYSTVADWRGVGPVEWRGVWYKQKADEFKRIIKLPRRISVPLELCHFILRDESDRMELEKHGWRLASPALHTITADAYQNYIFASRGEFTAVKYGYAAGRTGWFSDRSACYLAAGKPLITQDTGYGKFIGTGRGLFSYSNMDEVLASLTEIRSDYPRHCKAAREVAAEYFAAEKVLGKMLADVGL